MNKELIERLIRKNGTNNQTTIALEECSEFITELASLQKVICKLKRADLGDKYIPEGLRENLEEEIADVLICIEQLTVIFNLDPQDIDNWKVYKEDRLEERYFEVKEDDR